jgi:hypothetical protein
MIKPFHTLPDIMELGLLVAKIQNGSGADRDVDEAVMALFFTRGSRFIGVLDEYDRPVPCDVWVNPQTDKWSSNAPRFFTRSLDDILRTLREFLPETTWMIDAQAELPARAIVRHGPEFKVRTAPTPERALLTAFLVVCDQIQRAAA